MILPYGVSLLQNKLSGGPTFCWLNILLRKEANTSLIITIHKDSKPMCVIYNLFLKPCPFGTMVKC